jgi:hypothetical protein
MGTIYDPSKWFGAVVDSKRVRVKTTWRSIEGNTLVIRWRPIIHIMYSQ